MAKKRYYQTRKDREDESRGMRRYWADKEDANMKHDRYSYEDSTMIREDPRAPANLPQEVVHRNYPKTAYGYGGNLDDTIRGVDDQIDDDVEEARRHRGMEKY